MLHRAAACCFATMGFFARKDILPKHLHEFVRELFSTSQNQHSVIVILSSGSSIICCGTSTTFSQESRKNTTNSRKGKQEEYDSYIHTKRLIECTTTLKYTWHVSLHPLAVLSAFAALGRRRAHLTSAEWGMGMPQYPRLRWTVSKFPSPRGALALLT